MFDPHAEDQLVRPSVSAEDALAVASSSYNLTGSVKELGSNQDRNYLLTPSDRPRFLLKFDNDAFSTRELELQNETLLHLSSEGIAVPTPIRDASGSWISSAAVRDRRVRARLLFFVEGDSLVSDGHLFPSIISRMGELSGRVVQGLASLDDPALERDLQWDMRNAMSVIEAYAPEIADSKQCDAVLRAAREAWLVVEAHAAYLPVQAIHGDITDDNVVGPRDGFGRVVPEAVIDWGDLGTGWRVAEIAVTVSSIMHHNRGSPLDAMPAIAAFHAEARLGDEEMAVLWPLVVLRGAVIVASGAHQLALEPDNTYVKDRMAHEWHIFDTAAQLPLDVAHVAVRAVCGCKDKQPPSTKHLLLGGEVEYVRMDAASPHLHRGAFLDKDAEGRIAAEVVKRGKIPVFAYGETRLTQFPRYGFKGHGFAALNLTLHPPLGTQLTAPFDGSAYPIVGGVRLEAIRPYGNLIIKGVLMAGGDVKTKVNAGDVLGEVGEPTPHRLPADLRRRRACQMDPAWYGD